jgi:6-phosphogluconolactonase
MSTVAYVSNADSGSVTVLSLDTTDGGLHPVQELAVGGQLMPLALAADGRCLYAARRSLPLALLRFMIEPAQGRLGAPAETALPASMPSIALDATGRWLLAASYDEGIVTVCAVSNDAQAMPAHQVLSSGPKTHRILTTPDNRWALACVLGRDQLLRYRFDAARGLLSEPEVLRMPSGSGPRHLALHPSGDRAWVLGELDGSVTTVGLDADGPRVLGVTNALPTGLDGQPWAADLRLHPAGQLLVASERTSSTLALLRIDPADGLLHTLGHWPTQAQPRGFAISPCGQWLLCAGQRSHRVGLHRIDAVAGTLTFVNDIAVGRNPNWIEMLALP